MPRTTYDSVIYSGIFLTEDAKKRITENISIPKSMKVYCDHMTLMFKPHPSYLDSFRDEMGAEVTLSPINIHWDDNAICMSVDPNLFHKQSKFVGFNTGMAHITIATKPGIPPVYSNELLWRKFHQADETIHELNATKALFNSNEEEMCQLPIRGHFGVHTIALGVVLDKEQLLPGTIETVGNIS